MGALLDCDITSSDLQILSCIVGVAIYVSINPNLTFSIRKISFLGLPIFLGSIWGGPVIHCFIGDIRTRMGLLSITLIGSGISLLYRRGVPDSAIANCKDCN